MLSFDLRSIASNAAQVDGELSADDSVWVDDDVRPHSGVHVTGRLSRAGNGKYYFSGRLAGQAVASCRRCLREVQLSVEEEVHLLFADAGSEEAEEPDVYAIESRAHELDLRPALREEWLLAVPAFAECSETCLGLCPRCGVNRNEVPCSCNNTPDPRWGALSGLGDAT